MAFSAADVLELDLLLTARDEATNVIQGLMGTLQSAITQASGFQTAITQVQNNTTMTARDVAAMQDAVMRLNSTTGAPLSDLATGFMHISNVGYSAADAVKILTEANKSAISTGSQTADVANTLALQMHEFGASANDAGRYMNVLHLAAAEGNATLEQFVTQTSKSVAMAANLGIPITQVDAALASLSRHMDLSQANTALAGELSKLVNPTQQVKDELQHLSDVTGVKGLVADFTQAGMASRGLPGVMDDLRRATGGNVTEMLRLIPAMRGGLAEMVMLGTGSADYTKILDDLNATMGGKTDPTTQAYTRTLGTFNQSIAILSANWNQFIMAIGQPIVDALTPYLHDLIDWINTHKPEVDAFGKSLGDIVGRDIVGFVKAVPGMFQAVQTEVGKFTALTDSIGTFFSGIGTGLHNVVYSTAAGLYTMFAAFNAGIDDSITRVVGGIGDAIRNFNAAFNTNIGIPKAPPAQHASDIARDRQNFLDSLFGVQHPGGGSGFGDVINPATGKPYAGGGGSDPINGPGGSGSGSGSGSGAGGSGGPGGFATGTGADAPGYQSFKDATASARRALQDAQDQFSIDRLRGAGRQTLLTDIATVIRDMEPSVLGLSSRDRELTRLQLLQQIADHTKTTAVHVGGGSFAAGRGLAPGVYGFDSRTTPGGAASYGSSVAGFGVSPQDTQSRIISALESQLARANDTIAALKAIVTSTGRMADALDRPLLAPHAVARGRGVASALGG